MKKNIFGTLAFAAVAALAMTSCNKSQPQVEPASETAKAPANLKIAYVEVDSIMTQYTFAKEYSDLLQNKSDNIQKTIANKGNQLQAAAANYQQKIQQNAYTREQAEASQANLQRQQADLQGLQQRLGNEFQAETAKYNKALHDSIANYLKAYNKDKKYSIIFSKSGDNLLYADKAYDITNDVIAGLNKAYKGGVATAAKK